MGDANDKLETYVQFYYYAGGDTDDPVTPAELPDSGTIKATGKYTGNKSTMSEYVLYTATHDSLHPTI